MLYLLLRRDYLSRVQHPRAAPQCSTPGPQGARRNRPDQLHTLQTILLVAPILLFSVIAHEIAHGYAALRQGDRTALEAGRLSWNPLKHIDPYLTIILPLLMLSGSSLAGRPMVFGGAKPVPVDPRNYRHIRRGDIIVSLAGVATNLIIALVCAALIALTGLIARSLPAMEQTVGILQGMFWTGVVLNFSLILFNLLPIPPLDGSHVMKYLLPPSWSLRYVQFGRMGVAVLIVMMYLAPGLLNMWLSPALIAATKTIRALEGTILQSTGQWLQ